MFPNSGGKCRVLLGCNKKKQTKSLGNGLVKFAGGVSVS